MSGEKGFLLKLKERQIHFAGYRIVSSGFIGCSDHCSKWKEQTSSNCSDFSRDLDSMKIVLVEKKRYAFFRC